MGAGHPGQRGLNRERELEDGIDVVEAGHRAEPTSTTRPAYETVEAPQARDDDEVVVDVHAVP